MKAVMISIQPKWVKKIAYGEKTIEVRKSYPKLETPFKVYIYCTKGNRHLYEVLKEGDEYFGGGIHHGKPAFITGDYPRYGQKVLGEFVCDKITMHIPGYKNEKPAYWDLLEGTCLTKEQLWEYGHWKRLYGWHISELKIYEKPKELWEFFTKGDCDAEIPPCYMCSNFHMGRGWLDASYKDEDDCIVYGIKPLTRPPQSWCYVEELKGENG